MTGALRRQFACERVPPSKGDTRAEDDGKHDERSSPERFTRSVRGFAGGYCGPVADLHERSPRFYRSSREPVCDHDSLTYRTLDVRRALSPPRGRRQCYREGRVPPAWEGRRVRADIRHREGPTSVRGSEKGRCGRRRSAGAEHCTGRRRRQLVSEAQDAVIGLVHHASVRCSDACGDPSSSSIRRPDTCIDERIVDDQVCARREAHLSARSPSRRTRPPCATSKTRGSRASTR